MITKILSIAKLINIEYFLSKDDEYGNRFPSKGLM